MGKERSNKSTDSLVPTEVPFDRVSTDVMIAISYDEIQDYIDKKRSVIFRITPWSPDVQRVWIYSKEPVKAVSYVVTVGPLQTKGKLDPLGVHHKAFNAGSYMTGRHKYKAAYEVVSLHRLDRPLDYAHIVDQGWPRAIAHANIYLNADMANLLATIKTEQVI